jgi:hypothetical protein
MGEPISKSARPAGRNLWKTKTGDPNFWSAGHSFFAHSARLFTQPRVGLGGNMFIALLTIDNFPATLKAETVLLRE